MLRRIFTTRCIVDICWLIGFPVVTDRMVRSAWDPQTYCLVNLPMCEFWWCGDELLIRLKKIHERKPSALQTTRFVTRKRHLCHGVYTGYSLAPDHPTIIQGFRNGHISQSDLIPSPPQWNVLDHFGRTSYSGNGIGGSLSSFLWVNPSNFHRGTQRPTAAECWSCTRALAGACRFLIRRQRSGCKGKVDRTPGGLGVWRWLETSWLHLHMCLYYARDFFLHLHMYFYACVFLHTHMRQS